MRHTLPFLLIAFFIPVALQAQQPQAKVESLDEARAAKVVFLNPEYLAHHPDSSADPKTRLPLVIYLHGAGGVGDDVQKNTAGVRAVVEGIRSFGKGPCLVVAPQCRRESPKSTERGVWIPEDLDLFLEHLLETHANLDPDRVYLTGNSMGGYGCWVWGGHSPEHFAAIAPIVGGIGRGGPKDVTPDLEKWAANLAKVPVYAFVNGKDTVVPAERSQRMIAAIEKAGGKRARILVYPEEAHGASRRVYTSKDFFDWMFSQKTTTRSNQVREATGLAPEATDLNAADVSYELEHKLPYLETPYISTAPRDRKDGIPVGELGRDGGDKERVLKFAKEIARVADDKKSGHTDSLLISYRGKLLFESYYRRGRANYPHYQMSITKSYTAMALGRAIQLGHLTMDDLDKPAISFLEDLQPEKLVEGADKITLHEAMHMSSGIRLAEDKVKLLRKTPEKLKGQGQIQAYLQHSDPIPPAPREFKYQPSDPAIAMQVLEAVVPGSAGDFIRNELFGRMGVENYHWETDTSGLPKSAAGSSFRSRDMLKMGLLVLANGTWQNEQLIPAEFVERATGPIKHSYGKSSYGYFWWVEDVEVGGRTYRCKQGRGAGGQFIYMIPELDLIAVVTAHNQGMGKMLQALPQSLIAAFAKEK